MIPPERTLAIHEQRLNDRLYLPRRVRRYNYLLARAKRFPTKGNTVRYWVCDEGFVRRSKRLDATNRLHLEAFWRRMRAEGYNGPGPDWEVKR
jgi:hypothetical protein